MCKDFCFISTLTELLLLTTVLVITSKGTTLRIDTSNSSKNLHFYLEEVLVIHQNVQPLTSPGVHQVRRTRERVTS